MKFFILYSSEFIMTDQPATLDARTTARRIAAVSGAILAALILTGAMLASASGLALTNSTYGALNPSLVLNENDEPRITYIEQNNSMFGLLSCGDQDCDPIVGGQESHLYYLTPTSGTGGSLALDSAGNLVFSYSRMPQDDLMLLHCKDSDCFIAAPVEIVDSANSVGNFSSLVLDASGFPVISYYDATLRALKVAHCNDANCDSRTNGIESIQVVDSNLAGMYSSLALDSLGNPVIAYYDVENGGHLRVAHCNDPNCNPAVNGAESLQVIDEVGLTQSTLTLKLRPSDLPVVAYYDAEASALQIVACNDANCSSTNGAETPVIVDNAGSVGEFASMVLSSSSSPIISYYDRTNGDLKLAQCSTAGCTGTTTIEVLASAGDVGAYTRIAKAQSGLLGSYARSKRVTKSLSQG
jgi:hypothetical protein